MKIIKKIRLKKDTPDHKAGELFVLMSNNGIYEIDAGEDDPSVFYGGDIDNFDEWFEEVTDEWPQIDECYYRVGSEGSVVCSLWEEDLFDRNCQAIGNVFKTREAADQFANYLKAITAVRQDEGVLTSKEVESTERSSGNVWCIAYTFDSGLLAHTCPLDEMLPQTGAIYFNSLGHANDSLSNHPDEWKIIVNYDWSRE